MSAGEANDSGINPDELADGDYPPCYLSGCEDDSLVNPECWKRMKKRLDECGVPAVLEIGKNGGHGYGLGRNTEVKGWLDRAVEFMCRQ